MDDVTARSPFVAWICSERRKIPSHAVAYDSMDREHVGNRINDYEVDFGVFPAEAQICGRSLGLALLRWRCQWEGPLQRLHADDAAMSSP